MDQVSNILETNGLSKSFGALQAVDSVNFELPRGELRAIIGPNGAGKSTFFAMLMGRIRPSAGEIFVDAVNTSRMPPHRISRLGVSLAFQITNIFPNLTVAENLRIAAQSRSGALHPLRNAASQPRVEAKVDEILAEIGLANKKEEGAANLAHGEQKYLEIGIALAISPVLLLLDEPTAGMSPEETRATAALIKRLSEAISIVLVEHDMDVVMDIADRISVFHNGRVIAEGTPDAIRSDSEVQRVYLRGS
ncbi:MAG: ABC transporter ATP-binding protein [Alphaproteobacteria bacterium]|nr:ABC transporter ATP-binding protein [Alphaproteobacteria bacterium]